MDEDALGLHVLDRLAVGHAAVVDIARDIGTLAAVDGHVVFQLEEIAALALLHFGVGDDGAPVFGDDLALLDGAGCEQAQAVRATLHFDVLVQVSLHGRPDRRFTARWKSGIP